MIIPVFITLGTRSLTNFVIYEKKNQKPEFRSKWILFDVGTYIVNAIKKPNTKWNFTLNYNTNIFRNQIISGCIRLKIGVGAVFRNVC